ncbi:hypothetical protein F5Y19DRAFT_237359 [Xylariaceae sp. FL1651]|nr:hypothetical protein F5Y19DRAFT_237359 [Xylariaceae sp. FL1651]
MSLAAWVCLGMLEVCGRGVKDQLARVDFCAHANLPRRSIQLSLDRPVAVDVICIELDATEKDRDICMLGTVLQILYGSDHDGPP